MCSIGGTLCIRMDRDCRGMRVADRLSQVAARGGRQWQPRCLRACAVHSRRRCGRECVTATVASDPIARGTSAVRASPSNVRRAVSAADS